MTDEEKEEWVQSMVARERGRLGFKRRNTELVNGVPWQEQIQSPGPRVLVDMPTAEQWSTWGNRETRDVSVSGANVAVEFAQLVDARFPHPTTWMVALYAALTCPTSPCDSVAFVARITWGLGKSQFTEVRSFATLATSGATSLVLVGPVPAETVTIDGAAALTFGDATSHETTVSLGAFCSPQVWR